MSVDYRDFEAMHEQPGGAYAEALRQIKQYREALVAIEADTVDVDTREFVRTVLDA